MKKLYLTPVAIMLSLSAIAGNGSAKEHPNKYCRELKDGDLVVMHEGKAIIADVTLANGTIVKMDGTIVKKDGTTTLLKEGQCINKEGKIMDEILKASQ